MRDLFYKEFKLAIHPSIFLFLFFGVLLLIPSWPYFIAFGYIFISFMNTFFIGRSNHDVFFTASLPVRKKDIVRARFCAIATAEVLQLIVAIPFAYLNTIINPYGNVVGMNPNVAFFGLVFVMYAIFNAIFLPWFYKTAYKIGIPILVAVIAVTVYVCAVEFVVHVIPFVMINVNAFGINQLSSQLLVLIAGILIFVLATWLSSIKAAKNFEKVDL